MTLYGVLTDDAIRNKTANIIGYILIMLVVVVYYLLYL